MNREDVLLGVSLGCVLSAPMFDIPELYYIGVFGMLVVCTVVIVRRFNDE